jgi:hypothetical protein
MPNRPGPGCQIMTGRLLAEVAWMLPLWGGGSEMRAAFPTRYCARQPAGLVRYGSSPPSHSGQLYLGYLITTFMARPRLG